MMHFFKIAIIILCGSFFINSCFLDDKEEDTSDKSSNSTKVVLAYMVAENSLYKYLNVDLEEMVKGSSKIPNGDKLIVYLDDDTSTRIYELTNKTSSNPDPVYTFEDNLDSSDPTTLTRILNWVKERYEADEYAIAFSSHADGWLPSLNTNYQTKIATSKKPLSFGVDVGEGGILSADKTKNGLLGTQMNIDLMSKAIEESGLHLKYVFFDACLMQNIEVAYELRNVADYVIAAPIMLSGYGAYYVDQVASLFDEDVSSIAKQYFSSVSTNSSYGDFGLVISVIQTDKLDELATVTKEYIAEAVSNRESVDLSDVQKYLLYESSFSYRPEFYDAKYAMKKILSTSSYNSWVKIFDECLIYKNATTKVYIGANSQTYLSIDLSAYSGISMFIPQDKYDRYSRICPFGNLNDEFKNTSWYNDAGWELTGW